MFDLILFECGGFFYRDAVVLFYMWEKKKLLRAVFIGRNASIYP